MSCPEVSGVVALILSLTPTLSPAQIRAILAASAIDIGSTGKDPYFGYGMVNAFRALELARAIASQKENGRNAPAQLDFTERNLIWGKTVFSQKMVSMPKGVQKVEVFHLTGKRILRQNPTGSKILLPRSGIYFLALHSENPRPYSIKILTVR